VTRTCISFQTSFREEKKDFLRNKTTTITTTTTEEDKEDTEIMVETIEK